MAYRILVDENTSPRVAELLRGRGHDARHVTEALDPGVTDERILDYVRDQGYVVLTHDDDFLRPETTRDVAVIYYSDETLDAHEIADLVDGVTRYVPDPADLPPVTNLGAWE